MNSLKNSVVIILLLGVSYGVYQVVNAPVDDKLADEDPTELEILDEVAADNSALDAAKSETRSFQQLPLDSNPQFSSSSESQQPGLEPPPFTPPIGRGFGDSNMPGGNSGSSNFSPQTGGLSRTDSLAAGLPETQPGLQSSDINALTRGSSLDNSPPAFGANAPLGSPAGAGPSDGGLAGGGSTGTGSAGTGVFADSNNLVPIIRSQESSEQTLIDFDNALKMAFEQVPQGRARDALESLTAFYHADLPPAQRKVLLDFLDMLAGKVVFSHDDSLTGRPYQVQFGDTLESIARDWKVPVQLVYNINKSRISNPRQLVAGTMLKRINGPFEAEVDLRRGEMTLFVDGLYATRFQIDQGTDIQSVAGKYQVQSKSNRGIEYRSPGGQTVPPAVAENPYGKFVLDLGNGIRIHSRNESGIDGRGGIRLSSHDALDVFSILSPDSRVSIY